MEEFDVMELFEKIKHHPSDIANFTIDEKRLIFMLLTERAQTDTVVLWALELIRVLTDDIEVPTEVMPEAARRLLTETRASTPFKQVQDIVGMLDLKLKKSIDSMIQIEVNMEKEDRAAIHSWLLELRTHVDKLTALVDTQQGVQA